MKKYIFGGKLFGRRRAGRGRIMEAAKKMGWHMVHGFLLQVLILLSFSESRLLYEKCNHNLDKVVCRNVNIAPILRYELKFGYKYPQVEVDLRDNIGLEAITPPMVEGVFPRVKRLILGEIDICFPDDVHYEVDQVCNAGK